MEKCSLLLGIKARCSIKILFSFMKSVMIFNEQYSMLIKIHWNNLTYTLILRVWKQSGNIYH